MKVPAPMESTTFREVWIDQFLRSQIVLPVTLDLSEKRAFLMQVIQVMDAHLQAQVESRRHLFQPEIHAEQDSYVMPSNMPLQQPQPTPQLQQHHANVGGLNRTWHNSDLQQLVQERNPDVLIVTEAKYDELSTDEMHQQQQPEPAHQPQPAPQQHQFQPAQQPQQAPQQQQFQPAQQPQHAPQQQQFQPAHQQQKQQKSFRHKQQLSARTSATPTAILQRPRLPLGATSVQPEKNRPANGAYGWKRTRAKRGKNSREYKRSLAQIDEEAPPILPMGSSSYRPIHATSVQNQQRNNPTTLYTVRPMACPRCSDADQIMIHRLINCPRYDGCHICKHKDHLTTRCPRRSK